MKNYSGFAMDWKDFEKVIVDFNLHSLSDMYKWMSVLYQFGIIAMPVWIFSQEGIERLRPERVLQLSGFF